MKKAWAVIVANLLWPIGVAAIGKAWEFNYFAGLVAGLVVIHYFVKKPTDRALALLNESEYREWRLGLQVLRSRGWVNTLGNNHEVAMLRTGPHVTDDTGNLCLHWWRIEKSETRSRADKVPDSDIEAIADFEKMTLVNGLYMGEGRKKRGTFYFHLRWNDADPFEPGFDTRLVSRTVDGVTEFVNEDEWQGPGTGRAPSELQIAYRSHLRMARINRSGTIKHT